MSALIIDSVDFASLSLAVMALVLTVLGLIGSARYFRESMLLLAKVNPPYSWYTLEAAPWRLFPVAAGRGVA